MAAFLIFGQSQASSFPMFPIFMLKILYALTVVTIFSTNPRQESVKAYLPTCQMSPFTFCIKFSLWQLKTKQVYTNLCEHMYSTEFATWIIFYLSVFKGHGIMMIFMMTKVIMESIKYAMKYL